MRRECTDVHDRRDRKRRRRIHAKGNAINGVIAQLGERLPCTQEVSGSIPLNSTIPCENIREYILFEFKSKCFIEPLDLSFVLILLFNN